MSVCGYALPIPSGIKDPRRLNFPQEEAYMSPHVSSQIPQPRSVQNMMSDMFKGEQIKNLKKGPVS